MSKLSTFLAAEPTQLSDEDLILLTVLGRTFGRVVNSRVGEAPEDNLLDFLRDAARARDEDAAKPFLELIARLVDVPNAADAAHPLSRKVLGELDDDERVSVAYRVVQLLDLAGAPVPTAELTALAERFNPGPRLKGPPLSVYWQLVLSRFGSGALPDHKIPVCRSMVMNRSFLHGPLITTATARPHLFFNAIVPIIFEALRTPEDAEEEDWRKGALKEKKEELKDSLTRACRAGFRSLYRDRRHLARRRDDIRLLASQLEVLVSAGDFSEIAEAVVQAAAEATNTFVAGGEIGVSPREPGHVMPFAELALLEAGLSKGRAQHRGARLPPENDLKAMLARYVEEIEKVKKQSGAKEIDPILATNLIPYSEGVYFLIWRDLLQRVGLTIELKPIAWDEVLTSFSDGKLSFAVWNEYVPNSLRKPTPLWLTKKPLLTYKNYPFIMRRDYLEAILEGLAPSSPAREIVIDALAHDRASPVDRLKDCPDLVEAIRALPIGVVNDTDILEVARSVLGPQFIGDKWSSDDAVENLVDGGLAGAFLGGVQGHYLRRRFSASTIRLTEAPHPTEVHLWFMQETYGKRGYAKVVQPLLVAWDQVRQLWDRASSSSTRASEREALQAWIEGLAMNLNAGVDGVGADIRTPITSWAELKRLNVDHDELHEPDDVREIVENSTTKRPARGVKRTSVETVAAKGARQDEEADAAPSGLRLLN